MHTHTHIQVHVRVCVVGVDGCICRYVCVCVVGTDGCTPLIMLAQVTYCKSVLSIVYNLCNVCMLSQLLLTQLLLFKTLSLLNLVNNESESE